MKLSVNENSRILSLKKFWGDNLAQSLFEWKNIKSQIPDLKKRDDKVLLYFFKSPGDIDFKTTPFWFSKKIIGYAPEDPNYVVTDLDEGYKWVGDTFSFLTYSDIEAFASLMFKELNDLNISPSSTWGVEIDEESLCQNARVICFAQNRED